MDELKKTAASILARYQVLLIPGAHLLGLLLVLNIGTFMIADGIKKRFAANKQQPLASSATLDEATTYFDAKARDIIGADECFPLYINQLQSVNVLYLYCSEDAYREDGKAVQITKTFRASARIARRFHFWRRIYSLWGEDQYVLHLAEYPEVVLEVGDASPLGDQVDWRIKHKRVKRVLHTHRWQYKNLLWRMHKDRNRPDKFSPAMRRIAAKMRHIPDANKYLKAARSIRIQRGQRDQISTGLTNATRYFSAIEAEFVQEGIPKELALIAFIESSFNLAAYSKVGAAGVYQIMPATGRQYMIVANHIDERRDPIKSARAAAKLLKLNYKITGRWPLAVTAYNHGVGGINRAVRRVGSREISDLIDTYDGPAFGFASKNFFAGFLAILATINEADKLFPERQQLEPLSFIEIRIPKATSLAKIKRQYNLNNTVVRLYNPDIGQQHVRANGLLPRGYVLKIPAPAQQTARQPDANKLRTMNK